jgi:lipopolysaccharide/colanic/teichoic acid biosynthesis glycosyltransferase
VDSKRVLDVTVGTAALVVALPILAGVALVMRLSGDRGPLLYRARRVGEDARIITVFKIRTMEAGATGPGITTAHDPRVTRVGRVLRRYRIDELPQLLNVLRGEMSLVGPRPEDPRFVDLTVPIHRRVFTARPGITGPAQLQFHDEAQGLTGEDVERRYRDEILPAKLLVDVAYLDQRTTLLDIQILIRTARAILG